MTWIHWRILELSPALPLVVGLCHAALPYKLRFKLPHLIALQDCGIPLRRNEPLLPKTHAFRLLSLAAVILHLFRIVDGGPTLERCIHLVCVLYTALFFCFKPPACPPYSVLGFHVLHLCRLVAQEFLVAVDPWALAQTLVDAATICLIFSLPLSRYYPSTAANGQDQTGDTLNEKWTSPEDNLTLASYLFVTYMNPLLYRKDSQSMDDATPWTLSPLFMHRELYDALSAVTSSSLLRQYLKANALDLTVDISFTILSSAIAFTSPLLLKHILDLLPEAQAEGGGERTKRVIYLLILTSFALGALKSFVDVIQSYHGRRCYERTRGALMVSTMIKAMRRQIVAEAAHGGHGQDDAYHANVGEVLNLITGDSYAVAQWFWDGIANSIAAPFEVVIAVSTLYSILGPATFVSLAVFALFTLLGIPIARLQLRFSRKTLKVKDQRIALISEIIESIRLLKNFGWSHVWLKKATKARQRELVYSWRSSMLDAVFNLLVLLTPGSMVVAAFATYTKLEGHKLTIPVAFSTISIYTMLLGPLNMVPQAIMYLLRTIIAVRRLERFQREPEVDLEGAATDSLSVKDVVFAWPTTQLEEPAFKLSVLDLQVAPGDLVVITGSSSSGKTALLQALLGEMSLKSGTYVRPAGALAYAAQNPWAESITIRSNITFHTPYQSDRFEAVIEACDLKEDLETFPARDLTAIGERGVSLSGGQRMRMALARALYSHSTFVLLDDPFAALDAVTARKVLQTAILGPIMRNRAVVLVTHHLSLVQPQATAVYKVEDGQVTRLPTQSLPVSATPTPPQSSPSPVGEVDNSPDEEEIDLDKIQHRFMVEEARAQGRVRLRVYATYLKAVGWPLWVLLFILILAVRALRFGSDYVLKVWSEDPEGSAHLNYWLRIYISIVFAVALVSFLRVLVGITATYLAAKNLFLRCLERVISAPTRYFDTVPCGRILNRLVSDINVADSSLQSSIRNFIETGSAMLSALGVIVVLVPAFIPAALILLVCYHGIAIPYRNTARELRRLENKYRSPLFSTIGETIAGLATIRAFNVSHAYRSQMFKASDSFQKFDHYYWTSIFHLRVRFAFLGATSIALLTTICIWARVDQGWTAFAIVSAQTFVGAVHSLIWSAAQLELDLSSVERIDELLRIRQEKSVSDEGPVSSVPAYWPSSLGHIMIDNLTFSYDPSLPPVIRNLSLCIAPNTKMAIVGRTGSAKSTLGLALMRVAEYAAGSVTIDGLDITRVPLQELRNRVSYCPQEPLLFAGSLRENLSPEKRHSDEECRAVLEEVGLSYLELDKEIGSASLSAGERNLVSLARARAYDVSIVAATYIVQYCGDPLFTFWTALDPEADARIQRLIRKLDNAIVISIAHRLDTIIQFDSVVVMEDGAIVEQGAPSDLIQAEGSKFREMCRNTGNLDNLIELSKVKD